MASILLGPSGYKYCENGLENSDGKKHLEEEDCGLLLSLKVYKFWMDFPIEDLVESASIEDGEQIN
ncbi:hypothetical protein PVK06_007179 [Gossypium arboreum]|uniref:Uncharacterized protein n=1 Tax=Gossypium arboreum TaxID=29729 RepID=A0ABR0QGL0_GOSAR|nr:hypothetical protein PVK06_007179 [Gossypium arboreum]